MVSSSTARQSSAGSRRGCEWRRRPPAGDARRRSERPFHSGQSRCRAPVPGAAPNAAFRCRSVPFPLADFLSTAPPRSKAKMRSTGRRYARRGNGCEKRCVKTRARPRCDPSRNKRLVLVGLAELPGRAVEGLGNLFGANHLLQWARLLALRQPQLSDGRRFTSSNPTTRCSLEHSRAPLNRSGW